MVGSVLAFSTELLNTGITFGCMKLNLASISAINASGLMSPLNTIAMLFGT